MSRLEQIRSIVAAALRDAGDEAPLADDESLVASGRLASLDVVGILVAVETAFAVEVDPDEFDPMLFDSVESIATFLERLGVG